MYAVFKVQCWLMFYQPFKKKISFLLKSLVKPASILIRISPVFLFLIWRPPALPHRLQCSTIGRPGLNHRVRDENGCVPRAHRHQKYHWIFWRILWPFLVFECFSLLSFARLSSISNPLRFFSIDSSLLMHPVWQRPSFRQAWFAPLFSHDARSVLDN